ncbi:MAG TPA: DEAD/DEAH box helicase [Stellaceae bacterium]|nr:DEAD/DEAH box helicase [Stellaceae bacterium]
MNFSDLGLTPEVLRAVEDAGYKQPTPIQEQAIPYVLMGRDVLGCAQTGTGKTASFTLPMIDILASGRARARMPRTLVIEPTRELAAQVSEAFDVYGKHHKLNQALLIGGESFTDQERKLDRGVDVLIATPGRLIDLFERGKILLSDVKILVIDEADRMLDMGFIPDVERIVGLLPKIRQTLFFSATMPPEIRRLADAFLMNPKEIAVAPPASPAATVVQGLAVVESDEKREALRRLIRSEDVKNAIIFCNRKRDVDILCRSLKKHGLDVAALHGDMPQSKRTETLERFRNGEIRLLVASDVAARGLDIQGMSHVFNFDVPIHAEDYVHRIGRTGRAGREGRAFTLAAPEDGRFVQAIEQLIGKPIPPVSVEGIAAATLSFEEGDDRGRSRSRRGRSKGRAHEPHRDAHRGSSRKGEQRQEAPHAAKPHQSTPKSEPAHKPTPARYAPITMGSAPAPEPAAPVASRDRHNYDDGPRVVGFGDHMPAFLARRAARG